MDLEVNGPALGAIAAIAIVVSLLLWFGAGRASTSMVIRRASAVLVVTGAVLFFGAVYQPARSCACVVIVEANTVTVVVSTKDIPPNTKLDPLVDAGLFKTAVLPSDAMVEGAVTDPEQLRGEWTVAFVKANEQIPIERVGKPCGKGVCI